MAAPAKREKEVNERRTKKDVFQETVVLLRQS